MIYLNSVKILVDLCTIRVEKKSISLRIRFDRISTSLYVIIFVIVIWIVNLIKSNVSFIYILLFDPNNIYNFSYFFSDELINNILVTWKIIII